MDVCLSGILCVPSNFGRRRGSEPFFNYIDQIWPIIDHLPIPISEEIR